MTSYAANLGKAAAARVKRFKTHDDYAGDGDGARHGGDDLMMKRLTNVKRTQL